MLVNLRATFVISALLLSGSVLGLAQESSQDQPSQILINDVIVWDGTSDSLSEPTSVLIEGKLIKSISPSFSTNPNMTVINGEGRTLMPGLLDAHVHLMLNDAPNVSIYEKPWAFVGAQAVAGAKAMLLRGFTTVRDVGGPVAGLKEAIDMDLVEGPRVLPTGAFISQTSGHGDLATSPFKLSPYFTGIPDKSALFGWAFVADGGAA